jgi:FkbM family methyltransferase
MFLKPKPDKDKGAAPFRFFHAYYRALNAVGILNFRTMQESGEAHFLSHYLGSLNAPLVLDVGANKGSYVLAVKEACPSARILAFEPHPRTFTSLKTAVPTDVEVFNFGFGDTAGSFDFFDRADKKGGAHASLYRNVIEDLHRQKAIEYKVEVRRLDDFLNDQGLSKINLLKIDTEGHELAVFRGAEKAIRAGSVDVIQFEFNSTNVAARTFFKDFWDFLPDYNFYRLLPDNAIWIRQYVATFCEVFAFQNIVCVHKSISIFPNALATPKPS